MDLHASYKVTDITECITVSNLKLDDINSEILSTIDLYIDPNSGFDNYAFIPVYLPEYDMYQRYGVCRYVACLPYYTKLSNEVKLATVDHMNHDTTDNRCCNLRYVTKGQNTVNMCRNPKEYHGVLLKNGFSCDNTCRVSARYCSGWSQWICSGICSRITSFKGFSPGRKC